MIPRFFFFFVLLLKSPFMYIADEEGVLEAALGFPQVRYHKPYPSSFIFFENIWCWRVRYKIWNIFLLISNIFLWILKISVYYDSNVFFFLFVFFCFASKITIYVHCRWRRHYWSSPRFSSGKISQALSKLLYFLWKHMMVKSEI